MANFYDRLSATASRLMDQFGQGQVDYVQPGTMTGPAWAPVQGAPTVTRISAVKMSGPKLQEYAARGLIRETDILLAATGLPIEPQAGHIVRLGGVDHQLVMVDRVTVPGETGLVWFLGVRR